MANNLIKNKTKVFYTVKVKEGMFVRRAEFAGGRVIDLNVTDQESESYKYENKETAIKIALYTNGKIIKHSRTEVITEITEEIHVIKEDVNNG
ncbi:hypothetical protein KM914_14385 [Virgibacillus pantothenticus]|uniref:Uncharacterized protein n=1 Tax=Virgibacillus pantothenticus TaxID=1473 RepID=A0A0L0QMF4_VIRPA|nr:hypothetical protein [Virgibacillus pantothenticus]KNE19689.1 hypothetical protein AFK71_14665 [Virgibacillus pantothenticus]MBU8567608.1 hypothetical protein [Virgibacillus pantothenticus]MBU8601396.1 hypothetical protein [Virgibacillus pantothenticus]MBU8636213.1 hypothetical protein [Virgibacillus pantothenticus]MBU8643733.1 hypothetical protein [Virgibacillus pantothenticus]